MAAVHYSENFSSTPFFFSCPPKSRRVISRRFYFLPHTSVPFMFIAHFRFLLRSSSLSYRREQFPLPQEDPAIPFSAPNTRPLCPIIRLRAAAPVPAKAGQKIDFQSPTSVPSPLRIPSPGFTQRSSRALEKHNSLLRFHSKLRFV